MSYIAGNWNAICDVCGFKFKASEMRKRWDGLMTCAHDFEQDHPQKYLRVKEDKTSVPWVRTRPADVFVAVCFLDDQSAYADMGSADCAKANYTPLPYRNLI
jgi:hypothetical protein